MSPEIIQERSKGPLIWPMMPRNRRLGGFFNKQARYVPMKGGMSYLMHASAIAGR
jgi:hypothetical protein